MVRRIIILLTAFAGLCVGSASGQHYLGVRAGYGDGSVRFDPPTDTKSLFGLYSGGISYKYYSKERVLGGLEIDLLYIQKGFREPQAATPDTVYSRWVNSIEMPIFMQPHVYFLQRRVRMFLNAGVTFSYNINSFEELRSKKSGDLIPRREYDMQLVRDNRWGYGLCFGFGANYIMDRWELMAEARYNFGFADIYKNPNKYPGNPQRSPLDNIYIHAGVYYRLGKGGILSEASKRTAAKISEREAQRMQEPEKAPKKSKKTDVESLPEASAPAEGQTATPSIAPVAEGEQSPINPENNGNNTPAQSSQTDTEGR